MFSACIWFHICYAVRSEILAIGMKFKPDQSAFQGEVFGFHEEEPAQQ